MKKKKGESRMLGGPVYIALLRFALSLAGVIILFSIISEAGKKQQSVISVLVLCCFFLHVFGM